MIENGWSARQQWIESYFNRPPDSHHQSELRQKELGGELTDSDQLSQMGEAVHQRHNLVHKTREANKRHKPVRYNMETVACGKKLSQVSSCLALHPRSLSLGLRSCHSFPARASRQLAVSQSSLIPETIVRHNRNNCRSGG